MKKSYLNPTKPFLPLLMVALLLFSCSTENDLPQEEELNAVYAKSSSKKNYMVILKNESIPDDFIAKMESMGATVNQQFQKLVSW